MDLRSVERPSNELRMAKKLANPMTLRFIVANVGRATARELLVNLSFPTLTLGQLSAPTGAPRAIQHPSHNGPLWAFDIDHVHPGVHHISELRIGGITTASSIPIEFDVSMADARAIRGICQVTVT